MAKFILDSLSTKITPKDLRRSLERMPAVDETYDRVYDEAMERIRVQPVDHAQLAIRVLSLVVYAKTPLKTVEIQHALAIEDDETDVDEENIPPAETIISVCAGLVTMNEENGVVRLVHQTAQGYFEKRRHRLFPDIESQIAVACVRYLSFDKVRTWRCGQKQHR